MIWVGSHIIFSGAVFGLIVLVIAGVVLAVIAIVQSVRHEPLHRPSWQPPPPHPALAELDLRYARGDVTREEYLQRRADLLGFPGPPPATAPSGTAQH